MVSHPQLMKLLLAASVGIEGVPLGFKSLGARMLMDDLGSFLNSADVVNHLVVSDHYGTLRFVRILLLQVGVRRCI